MNATVAALDIDQEDGEQVELQRLVAADNDHQKCEAEALPLPCRRCRPRLNGSCSSKSILGCSLLANMIYIVIISMLFLHANQSVVQEQEQQQQSGNNSTLSYSYTRPDVVYAHVHMAKTVGSEINGELAAKFERVCGHKGYSYDAFQFNARNQEWTQHHKKPLLSVTTRVGDGDLISNQKGMRGYNRGRVPFDVMAEIGYEDCDWISTEQNASIWATKIGSAINSPLELHIPCREPIDHLMSMCNMKKKPFRCVSPSSAGRSRPNTTTTINPLSDMDIQRQVTQCLLFMDRFDEQQLHNATSMPLKCFNPIPMKSYLDYMSNLLQPKRMPHEYIHRASNRARNKDLECLTKEAHKELREQVHQYMISNIGYFGFCNSCMGSKNDLLLVGATAPP